MSSKPTEKTEPPKPAADVLDGRNDPMALLALAFEADADLMDRQYRGWAGHLKAPAERVIERKRAFAALVREQYKEEN